MTVRCPKPQTGLVGRGGERDDGGRGKRREGREKGGREGGEREKGGRGGGREEGGEGERSNGGSRNFDRGVRLAHTQRTAEGGAQSCEVVISPREARKNFLHVFFSDQEALS